MDRAQPAGAVTQHGTGMIQGQRLQEGLGRYAGPAGKHALQVTRTDSERRGKPWQRHSLLDVSVDPGGGPRHEVFL